MRTVLLPSASDERLTLRLPFCSASPQPARRVIRRRCAICGDALASASDAGAKAALVEHYVASHPNPSIEDNSSHVLHVKTTALAANRDSSATSIRGRWDRRGTTAPPGADAHRPRYAVVDVRDKRLSNARLEYVFLYDDEKTGQGVGSPIR